MLVIPLLLLAAGTVAACAPATTSIEVTTGTTVVDVRTPAEYAAGHLDGAVNLDVSAAGFETELEALDPTADYLVYCRSGSRSARAVALMEQAGFTSVHDAGGLSDAATATGLAVVD
ncbi:MAG: rhodanese-like domain-containing protein [Microbacterium sp.]|nr:rhodanese-like domain-containing protein [Microbacterium sp.]